MTNDTLQVWADGEEFILKYINKAYAYRPANEPGDWQPGLPSGLILGDVEFLFEASGDMLAGEMS